QHFRLPTQPRPEPPSVMSNGTSRNMRLPARPQRFFWLPMNRRLKVLRQRRLTLLTPELTAHVCRYMATTQVSKWGNSLGSRLPKAVAREAQLDAGNTVDVSVDSGAM